MLASIAVALLALAFGCAAAGAAGGSGVISVGGRIGPLEVDTSGRADVVTFAGRPDAEVRERILGFGYYDALGYACSATEAADNFTLGNSGPYCRTIFFVDIRSHKLEDFFTTDAGYRESHGIRIGTPTTTAERLAHTKVSRNCLVVLRLASQRASLRINFGGGHADTFAVHSLQRTSGLFNCLA
jgi:hypothetical protein